MPVTVAIRLTPVVVLLDSSPLEVVEPPEHVCYDIPIFELATNTNYALGDWDSNNNYQLDANSHFLVVAELNPEANPC